MLALLILQFVSFFSCGLILKVLIPIFRSRLLDHPNARSSHTLPTPRGGGVVFVMLTLLASASALLLSAPNISVVSWLPLLAMPLAFIGLMDDIRDCSAWLRYGVQVATAIPMVLVSSLVIPWFTLPLLVVAITAAINFTNFMDGLDGLVAGCMVVTLAAISVAIDAPWPLFVLVSSLLGFLLWNWSPAKVCSMLKRF